MPTDHSAPDLGRTLCVVLQHSSANSSASIRLRPDVAFDEITNVFLGDYSGVLSTVTRQITRPVSEVTTPEEVVGLESQPVDVQQETMTRPDPMSPLQSPLRNHRNPFTSAVDSLEGIRQPTPDADRGSSNILPKRSKLAGTRVALLIVGTLSLVVVPGLVLGVAAKQIPWGIALSGTIATMVSFFAGLYYYHNK